MIKKVMFVCNGNVIRSQIAACLFNKMFRGMHATSGGLTDTYVGRRVGEILSIDHPEFLAELKKQKVDISRNSCKLIRKEDVKRAEFVFVMEKRQKVVLQKLFPEFRMKFFVLGEFAHLPKTKIPNPTTGKDFAFCMAAYRQIKGALDTIKTKRLLEKM